MFIELQTTKRGGDIGKLYNIYHRYIEIITQLIIIAILKNYNHRSRFKNNYFQRKLIL